MPRTLIYLNALLLALVAVSAQPAWSQQICAKVLTLNRQTSPEQAKILELIQRIELADKQKGTKNPLHLNSSMIQTVFTHDVRVFEERLKHILELYEQSGDLQSSLKKFYEGQYFPADLIKPRLKQAEKLSDKNILEVLGNLSTKETLRLFVGKDPAHVEADSLLGRYLAESGVKLQKRAVTETGNLAAGAVAKTGPERLLVPIDQASFPLFKKYFSNHQAYSVFGHANMVFGGKSYSFGGGQPSDLGFLHQYEPLPFVLLKTTEGARMLRYMDSVKNTNNWHTELKQPWKMAGKGNPDYLSARGNFSCCTHWHGNIPVGDKFVNKIVLPGPNDKGVVAEIHEPQIPAANPELKDIWTFPLHEPISAVLGLAENNGRGEFASPGWVIQSLMVSAPLERVPAIFVFVTDAKIDVDPNEKFRFEGPW